MPTLYPLSSITAKTDFQTVSDSAAAITTVASGKTARVTSLIITNTTGTAATITVDVYRSAAANVVVQALSVPPNAVVVLIGKDAPLNLEENDALRLTSGTASALKATCSYDLIA